MEHDCKYEDKLIEMAGDIKTLLAEFRNMNGRLVETTLAVKEHEKDSQNYRRKVDITWAVVHSLKWVIIFLFGTGVLFKCIGL